MSSTTDNEAKTQQEFGTSPANENASIHVFKQKFVENMSIPCIRTPVLRAVPVAAAEKDSEPDSTNVDNASNKINDNVDYPVEEPSGNTSIRSLPSVVQIDENSIDNLSHVAYPMLQSEDTSDAHYIENSSAATLIQAPLNTAIVQNVTKLPSNFTINMDATVGNIATIQNVSTDSSGNSQTLWLPTILATTPDKQTNELNTQNNVSQIIITSDSYISNNTTQNCTRRTNMATETNYINRNKGSKVQILSNISLAKNTSYQTAPFQVEKELISPIYPTTNHVYKLNTNFVSQNQKTVSNTTTNAKGKIQQFVANASAAVVNANVKNISYGHTYSKNTSMNKNQNKVNNGANLNTSVSATNANAPCHILSRVISGPNKVPANAGRKHLLKGTKNSEILTNNQKQSRSIKIIQQTGSTQTNDSKVWPNANITTFKNQQSTYCVSDANNSKIIHKVDNPLYKGQQMPFQKFGKGERVILQSPCGPVILPSVISSNKVTHSLQSGPTPNIRYVHAYEEEQAQPSNMSQVSANQQLTAQILQSLSHPKLMLHTPSNLMNHKMSRADSLEDTTDTQKRIVFGDPSTLLTADEILGMEERPNVPEELRRYSFQSLAFVMLDHTYAQPIEKEPSPPSPVVPTSAESPHLSPTTPPPVVFEVTSEMTSEHSPFAHFTAKDDDAHSVSSLEGDREREDRGSDTDTAPEPDEEGKTRCICEFTHDDGYMICCDRCGEWQHVDCMGIDRQNIPDSYMCELCQPRSVDRHHARIIQIRKRDELSALATENDVVGGAPGNRRKRLLTVTTYSDTSGTSVTTYNPAPVTPLPEPSLHKPMRKSKKTDLKKIVKRKMGEKKVKRRKEILTNRKHGPQMPQTSTTRDSYESAVTNHYSPELRAKMMKCSNKSVHVTNMTSAITAHMCTTVPHAGGKILIATEDLEEDTPIIELRGKYMLSNQHRPQVQGSARLGSQKPGPFVFFYRLVEENVQICIDTRTYGNEARFVRRSCKPNARLRHCVVKGAVHVFLCSSGIIQADTEITVGHEAGPPKLPCACGNPKHCKLNGISTPGPKRNTEANAPREKRTRNRYSSGSSPASPPPQPNTPCSPLRERRMPKHILPVVTASPSFVPPQFVTPLDLEKPLKAESDEEKPIDLIAKEELKSDLDEPDYVPNEVKTEIVEPAVTPNTVETIEPVNEEKVETKIDVKEIKEDVPEVKEEVQVEKKETIEIKEDTEKIETVEMKEAVEKKEIVEVKKKEETVPEVKPKPVCHDRLTRTSRNSITQLSQDEDIKDDDIKEPSKEKENDNKKKMTREERKMEAIMKAFERMEKAQQRKQEVKERQKRRESDPHPNSIERDDDDDTCTKKRKRRKGRARTTSQCTRRRLDSASSDAQSDNERRVPRSPALLSPQNSSNDNSRIDGELSLSSACLLVEAAVGSVESAFKLPKTKKSMANEWVGRSPDRTPSPYRSPLRGLPRDTSLESLVRVASTMIGELSQTDRRIKRKVTPQHQHSAKKRWLRLAIEEENDDAHAESPPSEMVTPLKKRRMARESLSCEQTTPVIEDIVSPNFQLESSPIKDDTCKARNIMEGLYSRDRSRSDSGQGSDDQSNTEHDLKNYNLKITPDSEHIRRIIGVPLPEEEPPKIEEKCINNNVGDATICDDSNYNNKVVPMEIDHSDIVPQPIIKESEFINNVEKTNSQPQSVDNSGNSSPQRDEMDDIQKKIHSFHTENILFLKSRNKKPPKEKRKKVNLNFDLNMVDDQISIQLRTEDNYNGDIHDDSNSMNIIATEHIPLPLVETIPLPDPESIPLPDDPIPEDTVSNSPERFSNEVIESETPSGQFEEPKLESDAKPAAETVNNEDAFSSRFKSTGLFSGIFNTLNQTFRIDSEINDNVPNMQIIKSAIDKTTSLENSLFENKSISPADDLKNVQEILSRVNNMDSNNSVLLSGVLKGSPLVNDTSPTKNRVYCPGSSDPRLNINCDKPKPVRRKLSISEYRKRQMGVSMTPEEGSASNESPSVENDLSRSPLRLDSTEDLDLRLHKVLTAHLPQKGVFDAQPTASERQRENLSSRLRREFGLSIPDDDDSRPHCDSLDTSGEAQRCER